MALSILFAYKNSDIGMDRGTFQKARDDTASQKYYPGDPFKEQVQQGSTSTQMVEG